MGSEDVVVAGAGAAGLSVAATLEKRGIQPLVLERETAIAMPWERRYECLRLNTPRLTSTLARYRMPRRYGRWPTKNDMVEYLREYARRLDLRVQNETDVRRIDREGESWIVRTPADDIAAHCVVVATGHDASPFIPPWRGRDSFAGELIHSSAYRQPSPFRRRDVLVVSARNSGSEIAFDIARGGAARVRVAMRTPPNVIPREWLGMPLGYPATLFDAWPDVLGDMAGRIPQRLIYRGALIRHGLPRSPYGTQTDARRRHVSALFDAGFVDALKAGELELVAAVEAFEDGDVLLADGARLSPEVVIAATGYRGGLKQLVGHLGVLDASGRPKDPQSVELPEAPGLFFNGYRVSMSGQLRHMRRDARGIARRIARHLGTG